MQSRQATAVIQPVQAAPSPGACLGSFMQPGQAAATVQPVQAAPGPGSLFRPTPGT